MKLKMKSQSTNIEFEMHDVIKVILVKWVMHVVTGILQAICPARLIRLMSKFMELWGTLYPIIILIIPISFHLTFLSFHSNWNIPYSIGQVWRERNGMWSIFFQVVILNEEDKCKILFNTLWWSNTWNRTQLRL